MVVNLREWMDSSLVTVLSPAISIVRETLEAQEESPDGTLDKIVLGVGEDNHKGVNVNKDGQLYFI